MMALVPRERIAYAFMPMTINDNCVGLNWKKAAAYQTKIKKINSAMVLEEGVVVPYTGSNTSLCWVIPRTWKTTTTELLHRPLVGDKD